MLRLRKVFMSIVVTMTVFCSSAFPVFAQEQHEQNIDYNQDVFAPVEKLNSESELPDGWVVDQQGNYSNPETGEYLKWSEGKERGNVAKNFEFRIQYSITSGQFAINSNSVTVDCDAWIENKYGAEQNLDNGYDYTVSIIGLYERKLYFNTDNVQSGTISGLQSGGQYKVSIAASGAMPTDDNGEKMYLVGSGSVINN